MHPNKMKIQFIDHSILLSMPLIAGYLADIHSSCFFKNERWDEKAFAELLKNPFHHLCILYEGDYIQGFILYSQIIDEVEILTFAVHPLYQGQGKGKQILLNFVQEMKNRCIQTIFLEVNIHNQIACALYRGCGFTQTGKRLNYYGHDQHALILAFDGSI